MSRKKRTSILVFLLCVSFSSMLLIKFSGGKIVHFNEYLIFPDKLQKDPIFTQNKFFPQNILEGFDLDSMVVYWEFTPMKNSQLSKLCNLKCNNCFEKVSDLAYLQHKNKGKLFSKLQQNITDFEIYQCTNTSVKYLISETSGYIGLINDINGEMLQ